MKKAKLRVNRETVRELNATELRMSGAQATAVLCVGIGQTWDQACITNSDNPVICTRLTPVIFTVGNCN